MYREIVLAYDGSGNSAEALRQASEIAGHCKANLHMLGIVATNGAAALAQSAGAYDVYDRELKIIKEALEAAAKDLSDKDINVTTTFSEGDPASEILAHARRKRANLIVIGHRDQSVIARWFQGSVGARLLIEMPCSLLIAVKR